MFKTYHSAEIPQGAICTRHWDGDTHYWTVYDSQEEYAREQERLAKIDREYQEAKEAYLKSLG